MLRNRPDTRVSRRGSRNFLAARFCVFDYPLGSITRSVLLPRLLFTSYLPRMNKKDVVVVVRHTIIPLEFFSNPFQLLSERLIIYSEKKNILLNCICISKLSCLVKRKKKNSSFTCSLANKGEAVGNRDPFVIIASADLISRGSLEITVWHIIWLNERAAWPALTGNMSST